MSTPRLPPPVHELTATVMAPAAALSAFDGQIRGEGVQGLFLGDTRVLSEARLRFGDGEPRALARVEEGPGRTRFIGYAPAHGDPVADPTVRVDRTRLAGPHGMSEEIRVRSTATTAVRASVTVDLRCDLSTLEALKHGEPVPDLPAQVTRVGGGEPALAWITPAMAVTVVAPGASLVAAPVRLVWDVDLAPGAGVTLR